MTRLELRNEDADDGPYLAWVGGDYADHAEVVARFNALLDLLREIAPKCRECGQIATQSRMSFPHDTIYACDEHADGSWEPWDNFELGRRIQEVLP